MDPARIPPEIDTTVAHPARVYNAYLGGTANYPADRAAMRRVLEVEPGIGAVAWENRAFLQRSARFLIGEVGVRQVLDIGAGIPEAGGVHDIAAACAPETRIVYVDNDPIVTAYGRDLARSPHLGIVLADLRSPERIVADERIRALIDFTQPVALLLVAVLHFVSQAEDPARIVAALRDALAPGSYLALSHATADYRTRVARQVSAVYEDAAASVTLRSREEIAALFDGFDLVEPGLVQAPLWRPEVQPPPESVENIWLYAGVGRLGR